MQPRTLVQTIASLLQAHHNCAQDPAKADWLAEHRRRLEDIARNILPSGSGIDNGTSIDVDASKPERIVLCFGYHHMNDGGYYDGWTEHTAIVTPSLLSGFDIRITGRDRNQIKDYLYETYQYTLADLVVFDVPSDAYVTTRQAAYLRDKQQEQQPTS